MIFLIQTTLGALITPHIPWPSSNKEWNKGLEMALISFFSSLINFVVKYLVASCIAFPEKIEQTSKFYAKRVLVVAY